LVFYKISAMRMAMRLCPLVVYCTTFFKGG